MRGLLPPWRRQPREHQRTSPRPTRYSTIRNSRRSSNMSNILPLNASTYSTRHIPSAYSSQTSSTATIRPQQAKFSVERTMSGTPSQGSGLRYPSNKKSIYDRNLNRSKNAELSRAAFAYLFIEMIAYAQKGAKDVGDLEQRYVEHTSSRSYDTTYANIYALVDCC
jgi:hypothetical protein